MGPHAQWAYKHRGRVGAQWEQRHSATQWGLPGLAGAHRHHRHTGAQAPQATQEGGAPWGHPETPNGPTGAHIHKPTGAQAQTHSHRDTPATETNSHRDAGTQGHRDTGGTGTQRHRDTETQRHRDTETDTDSGKVGGVSVCVPCPHGWFSVTLDTTCSRAPVV